MRLLLIEAGHRSRLFPPSDLAQFLLAGGTDSDHSFEQVHLIVFVLLSSHR